MSQQNDQTTKPTISLQDLERAEATTAQRNLAVRTGVRAGGGGGSLGKFAKYV